MKIIMVAAVSENGCIGVDNTLPWRLPTDLKWFKKLTSSENGRSAVVMGRKSWFSIPLKYRPLPGRINIVVSSNPVIHYKEEAYFTDNGLFALRYPQDQKDFDGRLFVIGGASMYNAFLPYADEMYITHVSTVIEGDTFFPKFDTSDWDVQYTDVQADPNIDQYDFVVKHYKRVRFDATNSSSEA